MITLSKANFIFTFVLLLTNIVNLHAQFSDTQDKTLSPYFLIQSDDSEADQLPLESTKADVNIAGVIADVTVTQVYKNEGKSALEAIYVFPASTKAAVYSMKMTIGNRTIKAEIRERNKARQEYEAAKAEGKRVSLLEQERPNVFQMNVANIMPNDRIEVELKYTELLVPTAGVYQFVYPTVVGPRYSNQSNATASADAQFVANPYLKEKETAPYDFDIQVHLSAGMPIANINSSTHKIKIQNEGLADATIKLEETAGNGGNKDYILDYQLAGGKIQSGLMLYEHEDENFFLLMVQPPKKVATKDIPAREYIFIVDVSGSMGGFPLDISKKLLRDLMVNLRPTDKFNVILFAGTTAMLAEESMHATPENVEKAINVMDNQRGGGSTELLPALRQGLSFQRCEEGLSRSMIVITDGYVHVEKEAFDLIRNHLDESNLFSFGIGSSVNRHLIEGMAHVGMGEPLIITKPEHANEQADAFRNYIQSPVLSQVKADFGDFEVYDVEPVAIPDLLAERPLLIYGKWRGQPQGHITLKGYTGAAPFQTSFDVASVQSSSKNTALRYLWAREKIKMLDDYNRLDSDEERIQEVTNLGLAYNLMTAYTSFIAVDNEVVNEGGNSKTTKQALPLPEGVSNSAIGFDAGIEGVVRKSRKPKKTVIAVQLLDLKIENGTISEAILKQDLVQKIKTLATCYAAGTKDRTASFKITISKDGQVLLLKNTSGTFDEATKQRLIKVIQEWRFEDLNLEDAVTFEFSVA